MADTAFPDSYIESDTALETLIGGDMRASAIALKALSATVQAWYCQEATRHIDALALRGTKYEYDQDLEFPRIIDGVIVGDEDQNAVVPTLIKRACLEEALAIYANASGGRRKLQEEGVQSYTIGGKLSETFRPGAGQAPLESITAARILRRYTGVESR